jgi:L-threonylcarbamoyladenylate synthase
MTNTTSDIKHAAALLKAGKLVAFPTETVYGLGGNALDDDAVAAIYAAKNRPEFNPLIVHVRSIEDASHYVYFNDTALALAHAFWPGPLTLVLPRKRDCALSLLVSAGMDTVAVRMPAHPLAQALLHEAGFPIAAPSANRSGRISPTDAVHVREELGNRIAMIIDGGPCHVGIESTVLEVTDEHTIILRPGSITETQLVIPHHPLSIIHHSSSAIRSPGQLASHYAPNTPMRLNATYVRTDEVLLAFGEHVPSGAKTTLNLSRSGNLQEAAANLFRMLRTLDASDATSIAVMSIPQEELGIAINDRLKRAATPPESNV